MTHEEAIRVLKGDFAEVELKEGESHSDVFASAFTMAIMALEKQIKKKPIKVRCTNGRFSYLCPTCNIGLLSMCGCQNNGCGQAIDWEDE